MPEVLPRLVESSECSAFYLNEVEDRERHLDTAHGITAFRFHCPELQWRYGYFLALGAMGLVVLGLLLAFRRLGSIGQRGVRTPTTQSQW